jgi:hypothetical protein
MKKQIKQQETPMTTEKTEAELIWDDIKNVDLEFAGLRKQYVHKFLVPSNKFSKELHAGVTSFAPSSLTTMLENFLGNKFTFQEQRLGERVKYIIRRISDETTAGDDNFL